MMERTSMRDRRDWMDSCLKFTIYACEVGCKGTGNPLLLWNVGAPSTIDQAGKWLLTNNTGHDTSWHVWILQSHYIFTNEKSTRQRRVDRDECWSHKAKHMMTSSSKQHRAQSSMGLILAHLYKLRINSPNTRPLVQIYSKRMTADIRQAAGGLPSMDCKMRSRYYNRASSMVYHALDSIDSPSP